MPRRAADFESAASASSTIPAKGRFRPKSIAQPLPAALQPNADTGSQLAPRIGHNSNRLTLESALALLSTSALRPHYMNAVRQ